MVEKWEPGGDESGGPNRGLPNSSDMFSGNFPEGLRVLLFGEDKQYLHVLEKHLQEFLYEVTRCDEEERAMYLLCNHRNMFDVAILEAHKLDGKIFRLISEIGSEIDLPIIITSKDYSRESVTKWMRNGACDYIIKPIRPEDLRLIYKYLVKKMELRSVKVPGEAEEKAEAEKSSSVGDSNIRNPDKRKKNMFLDGQTDEKDRDHNRDPAKKRRVVWDDYLNGKFLEAIKYLGPHDAVPKKILEWMNISGLSRENVASHLQKYRLSQKKQEDENKKDERNRSLITPQRGMSSGERNVQFPTHHINNIPQPYSSNLNLMTQRISTPPGNHHDNGLYIAPSSRNLVTTHHQHHHIPHHQISENVEERLAYNEEEEGLKSLTSFFTQNPEQMNLLFNDFHLSANPQQMMYVHEPSMVHIPSLPSSLTHNHFLDQRETITMVDLERVLYPEQQQANLTNENGFLEADPARRDEMGQDQGQS